MKKLITSITFGLLIILPLLGQQESEYTYNMFNGLVLNPGYAGTKGGLSLAAVGRYQWVGIEGAPRTVSLSGHTLVKEKMGVGLFGEYDQLGVHKRISTFASYAYHIGLTEELKLSIGLQGGFTHLRSNWTELNVNSGDPNFMADETSKLLPNFGTGFYLFHQNFYLGFAVPKLLTNKYESASKDAREYRHYLLSAGALINVSDFLKLKPAILLKSVPANAPLEADLHLGFVIKDVFYLGGTYRTKDSADILASILLHNGFRFGYAYDFTLTQLKGYNDGTHEIMVGMDFGDQESSNKKARYVTPRYF